MIEWKSVLVLTLALICLPACGSDATGQPCGGNIRNAPTCPSGYQCVAATEGGPAVGDVGGVCARVDAAMSTSGASL